MSKTYKKKLLRKKNKKGGGHELLTKKLLSKTVSQGIPDDILEKIIEYNKDEFKLLDKKFLLEKRIEKAKFKIKEYESILKFKKEELKKITPKRVTRSQKKNISNDEKLSNDIKKLENTISALKYRINNKFRDLSPRQDDLI